MSRHLYPLWKMSNSRKKNLPSARKYCTITLMRLYRMYTSHLASCIAWMNQCAARGGAIGIVNIYTCVGGWKRHCNFVQPIVGPRLARFRCIRRRAEWVASVQIPEGIIYRTSVTSKSTNIFSCQRHKREITFSVSCTNKHEYSNADVDAKKKRVLRFSDGFWQWNCPFFLRD